MDNAVTKGKDPTEGGAHQGYSLRRSVASALLVGKLEARKCVEAYHLQPTRFESIAERKLRRRQLTEDGNVEISGRDLREGNRSPRRLFSR
jgi:hypothetical protein